MAGDIVDILVENSVGIPAISLHTAYAKHGHIDLHIRRFNALQRTLNIVSNSNYGLSEKSYPTREDSRLQGTLHQDNTLQTACDIFHKPTGIMNHINSLSCEYQEIRNYKRNFSRSFINSQFIILRCAFKSKIMVQYDQFLHLRRFPISR